MRCRNTALVATAAGAGLAGTGPVAPSAGPTGYVPVQVQSRTLADAAGRVVSVRQPRTAAVTLDTEYRFGSGQAVSVETPPPGFSATTASPALRLTGGRAPGGIRGWP
jgi:hypothetical protein